MTRLLNKRERAETIEALYAKGETLQKIADGLGICRERVRQILKDTGIGPKSGGIAVVRALKAVALAESAAQKKENHARRWGLSSVERAAIRAEHGYKPFGAYIEQRRNAHRRRIAWEMNFAQWWSVWQQSGHWEERGRGFGYCMARHGDAGPYSTENVYICTCAQNFADYRSPRSPQEIALST